MRPGWRVEGPTATNTPFHEGLGRFSMAAEHPPEAPARVLVKTRVTTPQEVGLRKPYNHPPWKSRQGAYVFTHSTVHSYSRDGCTNQNAASTNEVNLEESIHIV